jgi:zinc transporter 7
MYELEGKYSPQILAILATITVSILPNLLLIFIPSNILISNKKSTSYFNYQHILLCFASGGLLGDVLLHIIPHLLSKHNHEHNHENHHHNHHDTCESEQNCDQILHSNEGHSHNISEMYIPLLILIGFLFFFVTEKFASRYLNHDKTSTTLKLSNSDDDDDDDNNNNNNNKNKNDDKEKVSSSKIIKSNLLLFEKRSNEKEFQHQKKISTRIRSSSVSIPKPNINNRSIINSLSSISVTGWLNILADSLHNFTDGLCLGAAFSSGGSIATASLISILIHEIPHEIGDFSILIESGLT